MRPSSEKVGKEISTILEKFRLHAFEYKNTVTKLQAQISELEISRTKKNIDLQENLMHLQEADEMLRIKYAEYAEIGNSNNSSHLLQNHIYHIDSPDISRSNTPKSIRNVISPKKMKGLKSFLGKKGSNRSTETLATEFSSSESIKMVDTPTSKVKEAKYHKFLSHAYRSLKKCNVCQENMWGKELKCDTCNFHCHIKCSTNANTPCVVGKKPGNLQGESPS